MFVQHRTIGSLFALTILVMLLLVLAGCRGAKPTATPTPEVMAGAATPAVTILRNPNITIVPAGGQVALAVEATGVNLKITWRPKRGKVSNPEGPSTIYTAPATPGIDTVDVTATSDTGSTTRTVTFTVVEAATERPAATNTPPISTEGTTASKAAGTPTLTTTVRSVTPATPLGTLYVKALKGCSNWFDLKVDDQSVGGGKAGAKTEVAVGTYDIILHSSGTAPMKSGVVIREGEETVVDFTRGLGILLLTGYPQLEKPLEYRLYSQGDEDYGREFLDPGPSVNYPIPMPIGKSKFVIVWWDAGVQYCVSPGVYKIVIKSGTFVSAGIGQSRFIRAALFPTLVEFDVEIEAGEKTVVGPETLPLGLLSFDRGDVELDVQIHDFQTGDEVGHFRGLSGDKEYWTLAGTYKIVITKPYPGLTFEKVEIKAGEETVLQLSDQPSPTPTLTRGTLTPSPTPAPVTAVVTTKTGIVEELSEFELIYWAGMPIGRDIKGVPTQSGVEVSWDYIERVEIGDSQGSGGVPVTITLVNGSVLEEVLLDGSRHFAIKGLTDIGPFSSMLQQVKSIRLQRTGPAVQIPEHPPDSKAGPSAVVITRSGDPLDVTGLQFSDSEGQTIPLVSGRNVYFAMVREIRFGEMSNGQVSVTLVIADGQTITDTMRISQRLLGNTVLGILDIRVEDVATVMLQEQ